MHFPVIFFEKYEKPQNKVTPCYEKFPTDSFIKNFKLSLGLLSWVLILVRVDFDF